MKIKPKALLYAFLLFVISVIAALILIFFYAPVISVDDTVLSTLVLNDFSDEHLYSHNSTVEIMAPDLFQYEVFKEQVKPGDRVFYRTYKSQGKDKYALSISVNNHIYLDLQDIIDKQTHDNETALIFFTVSLFLWVLCAIRLSFIVFKKNKETGR